MWQTGRERRYGSILPELCQYKVYFLRKNRFFQRSYGTDL